MKLNNNGQINKTQTQIRLTTFNLMFFLLKTACGGCEERTYARTRKKTFEFEY